MRPSLGVGESSSWEAIRGYLGTRFPQFAGTFTVARLGAGQSCLNYLLEGDGWSLVLRRPPHGQLPSSAHDVVREYRVMSQLAGSAVPVPGLVALCEDSSFIGSPFYLMEPVRGVNIGYEIPIELASPSQLRAAGLQLVEVLVRLHDLDVAGAGLESFGRPHGYLERQLHRMHQRWEVTRSRDIPEIDELYWWLERHRPETQATTLVHGDYKLDNVMYSVEDSPRLVAVLDWEMSTLGDPLADLGWLLYFWRDPGEPQFDLPVAATTDHPALPRRSEIVSLYAEHSSLDASEIRWYVALAGWKIAIIMEGSYQRYLGGAREHETFATLATTVPQMARRAWLATQSTFGL